MISCFIPWIKGLLRSLRFFSFCRRFWAFVTFLRHDWKGWLYEGPTRDCTSSCLKSTKVKEKDSLTILDLLFHTINQTYQLILGCFLEVCLRQVSAGIPSKSSQPRWGALLVRKAWKYTKVLPKRPLNMPNQKNRKAKQGRVKSTKYPLQLISSSISSPSKQKRILPTFCFPFPFPPPPTQQPAQWLPLRRRRCLRQNHQLLVAVQDPRGHRGRAAKAKSFLGKKKLQGCTWILMRGNWNWYQYILMHTFLCVCVHVHVVSLVEAQGKD